MSEAKPPLFSNSLGGLSEHTKCENKRIYLDETSARNAAWFRSTVKLPLDYYQCKVCNLWHLTKSKFRGEATP